MGVRFKDLDLSFGTVKIPASQKDLTIPAYKSLKEAMEAFERDREDIPMIDWACTVIAAYNDVDPVELTVDDCLDAIASVMDGKADQGK